MGSALQTLLVHGHEVLPHFHRVQSVLRQNHPPSPLLFEDTPSEDGSVPECPW
jgi:hypothetical protein